MKKLILLVLLVSLFAACKKKDKTCKPDMPGLSGSHRITAVTYKADASAAEQNYYDILYPDACQKDDVVIFKSDGTYTFTDAGVQCTPASNDTGDWSVSSNTITIDGDPFSIQSFNCSTLVILLEDFNVVGDQVKYTFTRQ
jgi:hypothetical protein